MTNSNNDLHALFVKHSIRPFKIKLNRLSKEGWKIKITQLHLKTHFFYSEYRTAVENTLLRRYNIQECYVETVRLDDYGKTNSCLKK